MQLFFIFVYRHIGLLFMEVTMTNKHEKYWNITVGIIFLFILFHSASLSDDTPERADLSDDDLLTPQSAHPFERNLDEYTLELDSFTFIDAYTGRGAKSVNEAIVFGERLFFIESDEANGRYLWVSNGTSTETMIVKDISLGNGIEVLTNLEQLANRSKPDALTAIVGDKLYILTIGEAYDSMGTSVNAELWQSDGTETGTVPVEFPGLLQRFPPIEVSNSLLFFNPPSHMQLWQNKTGKPVPIFYPGGRQQIYGSYGQATVDETTFYLMNLGGWGATLWKSDGTFDGTTALSGVPGAYPGNFFLFDNSLYFTTWYSEQGEKVWKSDAPYEHINLFWELETHRIKIFALNHRLTLLTGNLEWDRGEWQMWVSDGKGKPNLELTMSGSAPYLHLLANVNGRETLFFFHKPDTSTSLGLWKSDGTREGTLLIKNGFVINEVQPYWTHPVYIDGLVFFMMDDGIHGHELWVSDGTEIGTRMVENIAPGQSSLFYRPLYVVDGRLLFFSGADGWVLNIH
jgi:ELWxxDGT repeat protein